MKIKVIKQIVRDKDGSEYDIISYKIKSIEKCCDDIINNPAIELSSQYDQYQNEEIYSVFLVHGYDNSDPYERYNSMDYNYFKINHCPFCGEKIEIEIIDEIYITEEYYRLKGESDKFHKKWCDCDSIKRKRELENLWREYDKKINEFYQSEGFEKIK